MLASTLRGAISQRLIPRCDRDGRVAAAEVMVGTGRVKDLILQPDETAKISEVIAEGSYYGMRTFDQDLLEHVQAGHVSPDVAMAAASRPHDFKLMLEAGGQRASGIEQLSDGDLSGAGGGPSDGSARAPAGSAPPIPAPPAASPAPPAPAPPEASPAPSAAPPPAAQPAVAAYAPPAPPSQAP